MLLETLIDLALDAIFIADLNGYLIETNAAACQLLGYGREELLGKAIADFIAPEDHPRLGAERDLLQQGKTQIQLWTYLHKDGSRIRTEVNAKILPDGRWVAFVRDRRDAERNERIRQQHERFLFDLDLRLRQLSDADEMLWEAVSRIGAYLNVERCVWHEVNVEEDLSIVKQDWRRQSDISSVVGVYSLSQSILPDMITQFQAGKPAVVPDVTTHPFTAPLAQTFAEMEIRAFVGIPCLYEGRWVAVLAINARTVQAWRSDEVALLQEVVARLWSIIEQTRTMQALNERTNHIQLLYETTRDLLFAHQPLALIQALFTKLKPLMGLDVYLNYVLEEEQQQLHLMFYGGISEDLAQPLKVLDLNAAICGLAVQQRCQMLQFDIQNSADPTTQHVRSLGLTAYACQPMIAQGKLFGILSFGSRSRLHFTLAETNLLQVLCDQIAIALERSQLVDSLQQQTEELKHNHRLKDDFFSALSHELRTPLNPILGWTKMLQTQKLPPDRVIQALATIERNVQQQIKLVDDLLDVSRVIQGKMCLETRPVDLTLLLRTAIETMQLAAQAKGISLQLTLPEPASILGDEDRLQQVFWNLLSNAIKFTPEGGHVDIRLSLVNGHCSLVDKRPITLDKEQVTNNHHVEIRIADTGIGIAPNFQPYVFEYFRQAEGGSTRRFGGLGLGLAIVRHLVELHGGTVTVESPGLAQGATFIVRLPLLGYPAN